MRERFEMELSAGITIILGGGDGKVITFGPGGVTVWGPWGPSTRAAVDAVIALDQVQALVGKRVDTGKLAQSVGAAAAKQLEAAAPEGVSAGTVAFIDTEFCGTLWPRPHVTPLGGPAVVR